MPAQNKRCVDPAKGEVVGHDEARVDGAEAGGDVVQRAAGRIGVVQVGGRGVAANTAPQTDKRLGRLVSCGGSGLC